MWTLGNTGRLEMIIHDPGFKEPIVIIKTKEEDDDEGK